jgi:hypothetical protein
MGEKQQKKKKQEGLANGQPFMNRPGAIGTFCCFCSARFSALEEGFSLKALKNG